MVSIKYEKPYEILRFHIFLKIYVAFYKFRHFIYRGYTKNLHTTILERIVNMKISNCNNIDTGEISIIKNRLNIKYAFNGTGKSTISSAIIAKINNDDKALLSLTPFKNINTQADDPSVEGLEEYQSVKIFNDDYVNQYVFQPDELLKNSFEIFIKSKDYDEHLDKINDLVNDIHNVFNNDDEINGLIYNLNDFLNSYGNTKTVYSKTSALGKGLGNGNKLTNIPDEIKQYTPFLIKPDTNVKWLKWQMNGKEFQIEDDICPYCAKDITTEKEHIQKVQDNFDSKEIDSLNKIIDLFNKFEKYFSNDTNIKIKEISSNITGISDEQKEYLRQIRDQVRLLKDKLENLNNLSFLTFKNVEDEISKTVEGYKTDLSYIEHLNSDFVKEKIDKINASIDEVLSKIGQIKGEVIQQKNHIKITIEKYQKEINSFLQTAGYKYYVSIDEMNEEYKLRLYHKDYDQNIPGNEKHLSYGERNAFALALFMYEALNDNPDLVILDDPISSFDGNKRFAIINMLFMGSNSFKDKTVLLFTHEFNIVIDTIYNFKSSILPSPNACFLSTVNSVLSEKPITKNDICSFVEIAKRKLGSSIDVINKAIYLRRLLELQGDKGFAWNLLSSLFHKRDNPTVKIKTENSETTREMTDDEILEAEKFINNYISDFDYQEQHNRVTNNFEMKDLYSNCNSNYEKMQIFRIIFDGMEQEDVFKKFINETYHIENDYLFQLDPAEYETVPSYIIEQCDRLVTEFEIVTIS